MAERTPTRRVSLFVLTVAAVAVAAVSPAHAADLAGYVNPFNGTLPGAKDFGTGGGAGNTFPGPVTPFGMMQWSPDTSSGSKNAGGGYAYGDTRLRGFSVRRLSGAGCPNGGDFPFLPTTRAITAAPTDPQSTSFSADYLPVFSHTDEDASPGYYRVALDPTAVQRRIDAQLTATTRSGIAEFSFPAGQSGSVLINATGSRTGAAAGDIHIDAARREVTATVTTGAFCYMPSRYKLYVVARFDRPFAAVGTWTRQTLNPGSTDASDVSDANPLGLLDPGPLQKLPTAANAFTYLGNNGKMPTAQTGGYVSFDPAQGNSVELRVGMSFVSVDAAKHNLDAEAGTRSFDAVRAATRSAWNSALGAIEIDGGQLEDRQTFYSMLYHTLISPTTYSDADGSYRGMDDTVHPADGHVQYADFSGWDVYRSQMPLLALIAPRQAADIVTSLLADQRDSGWLPKWSVANTHTEVMSGDPADPTIAAIWALGVHDFDGAAALAAMVHGATASSSTSADPRNGGYTERTALAAYEALGYVPDEMGSNLLGAGLDTWRRAFMAPAPGGPDLVWGSAGTTLEYATADFAVARMAAAQGDPATCRTFLSRSGNWHNVFDPSIGYIHPRSASGQWTSNYDPNYNDSLSGQGFPEGDGAQYTWMVPHDPAGLFAALGGHDAALSRLDAFFTELNAGFSSPHAFLGNEPNSNAPWLYDWLGQPWKTQDIMRRAILGMFDASPGGYPGNDDLGQMSAWYVFGALGLYPVMPGTDVLALGSPLFPHATVHLRGGDLDISGPNASRATPYVQGLQVNGTDWSRPWLRLADVAGGGRLAFDLAATKGTWGGDTAAAPPSYGPDDVATCSR